MLCDDPEGGIRVVEKVAKEGEGTCMHEIRNLLEKFKSKFIWKISQKQIKRSYLIQRTNNEKKMNKISETYVTLSSISTYI